MKTSRQWLNDLLRPLAARIPLSPNLVTLLACWANLFAAYLLTSGSGVRSAEAILLIGVGGLLDALDGAIARARNLQSRFGDFLDHYLDRVSDAALTAGWCLGVGVTSSLTTLLVALVLLAGYAGTQVEATFGVRNYEGTGRAEFVFAIMAVALLSFFARSGHFILPGPIPTVDALALLLAAGALLSIVQRFLLAGRLSRESGQ